MNKFDLKMITFALCMCLFVGFGSAAYRRNNVIMIVDMVHIDLLRKGKTCLPINMIVGDEGVVTITATSLLNPSLSASKQISIILF